MRKIEFLSYDGKWPNLCGGRLGFSVDGEAYFQAHALVSGGCCFLDSECNYTIEEGEWSLDIDIIELTDEELDYLTELVNSEVSFGCCGGCL